MRVRNDQTNSVCPVCKGGKTRLVWRHLPELRFGIPDLFSIRRCVECGTCLTDPLPDQRYLEKIYQNNYVPAEYVPPNRLATVSEVEGLLAGKTVLLQRWTAERSTEIPALFYQPDTSGLFADCRMILDVGAYTGENMLWLAAGGRNVIGVEPNPKAARVAAELGLDVRPAYVSDCSFPDASFDLIYMSYVIEHLLEPRKMLLELRRLLKPGGRLLLTTHNVHSLWRYVFGPYWINWHTPFHIYHFHTQSLRLLLEELGYSTVYLKTRTPAFWLLLSIRAVRDSFLYHCPHKRLYEPLQPQIACRLHQMLRLESGNREGDCIIGVFERAG